MITSCKRADFDILLVEISDVFGLIEIDDDIICSISNRRKNTVGHIGREGDMGKFWTVAFGAVIVANNRTAMAIRSLDSNHDLIGMTSSNTVEDVYCNERRKQ